MTDKIEIPKEIKGLNWGAFFMNWIWGLGNNTFIALASFIPGVGLVMPFVLLFKGNEWAWQNGNWKDIKHFKRIQRRWTIIGLILFIIGVMLFTMFLFAIDSSISNFNSGISADSF